MKRTQNNLKKDIVIMITDDGADNGEHDDDNVHDAEDYDYNEDDGGSTGKYKENIR